MGAFNFIILLKETSGRAHKHSIGFEENSQPQGSMSISITKVEQIEMPDTKVYSIGKGCT